MHPSISRAKLLSHLQPIISLNGNKYLVCESVWSLSASPSAVMTNITSEICTGWKVTKDGLSAHQQTQAEKNHFALRSCLWTLRGHPSEIREGCTFHTESAERTELRSVVLATWHLQLSFSARNHGGWARESHVMPRVVRHDITWWLTRVCLGTASGESNSHRWHGPWTDAGMANSQDREERENNDRRIRCALLERACPHQDHVGWKWKQLLYNS